MNRLPTLGLTLSLVCMCSPMCPGQIDRAVVAHGQGSTAFVEVDAAKGKVFGSAFCAEEPGFFITNAHVIQLLKEGGEVKLALRTGELDQRVITAKVYRADPAVDLALLTTEVRDRLTPLSLGRDDDLFVTMQTAVFGYPFGKELALRDGEFPSITVNLPRVSSLPKEKGKLQVIQFDGQLNPGNSGGPVLGGDGKVIGVANATVVGGGLNFAIPVGKLAQFLAAPGLEFKPPELNPDNYSEPTTWTIRVLPSKPSAPIPEGLSASVKVTVDGKSPRTVTADPDGKDRFKVTITPIPESMVTRATEMKVEVVIELKQGPKLLATAQRVARIVRPMTVVITPGGRALMMPGSDSQYSDKGSLTVDGKLDSAGVPRGAGRSIRPPQAAIGPVRLTLSPDPPSPTSIRLREEL